MNLQSLRNKIDKIRCFVKNREVDVLLLVETWLSESETPLFELDGYDSIHSCREKRGGGASIYLKKGIQSRVIAQSESNELINWLCVTLGRNLSLSLVYRPPKSSCSYIKNYVIF